jgi:PAS domain S-box-containing protein
MIFKENLTRKILYLAIILVVTIAILVLSYIYEYKIVLSFENRIDNLKVRELLIRNIEHNALLLENKLHEFYFYMNQEKPDLNLDFIHSYSFKMTYYLETLNNGGKFEPFLHESDKLPANYHYIYEKQTDTEFLHFELITIQKLIETLMNRRGTVDNLSKLIISQHELEASKEAFSLIHKKLEKNKISVYREILNLQTLQLQYLHSYRFFRIIILFCFILFNYILFRKTINKIMEIIKERNLLTMNINSMNKILLEKRDFITAVLNSVTVGIVVVEAKEQKIIDTNSTALQILNLSNQDVIDKNYATIFKDSDLEEFLLQKNSNFCEKEVVISKDEDHKVVIIKHIISAILNDRLCYVINFMDITKQKQTEKILLDSEQFNRAIIENSPIGISVRDKFGRLILGNLAWRKIWNITDERYEIDIQERRKLNFDERDNYMKEHWNEVKKVYTEGGEYYIPELHLQIKEGRQTTWISHHFYALCDAKGNVEKVVILSEDISMRKETEFALHERDIRYKTLFEQANDAIFLEDYHGVIIDGNQEACALTGYTREELFGMKMESLKINDPLDYLQSYEGLKIDKNIRFESRLRHKDGREIPIEKTIAPFADRDNMLFLSIMRDISARKKNEYIQSVLFDISNTVNTTKDILEMYTRIHQLLGNIIDTKNFYIAIYDRDTNLIEAAYYKDEMTTEIPPVQQMGRGLTAYVISHQKSLYLTAPKRQELIASGEIPEYNWRAKVWLGVPLRNQNHQIIGAMAVQSYQDAQAYSESDLKILEFVSDQVAIAIERKKAEDLLRESEEKARAFMNSATDSMTIWDKKGTLIAMNPASLKMLNLKTEISSLIGKNVREITPFMEANQILENAFKVYETGIPYFRDYVAELKDIGERYFAIRIFKFSDNIGAIVSDITDRKITEEKIRSSLKEKEVMLKEIHHRVKNNMQVVSSLLNLQSKYIVNEKDLELFKESQNRVKSMSLVHEKLYQSRNLANIDFYEYTRNLIRNLYITYGVNGSQIQLSIDILDVYLDINIAIPCGLIINEIVSNSLKYAFPDSRKGIIKIFMQDVQTKITMIISDDGIGLPEDIVLGETDSLGLQLVHTLSMQLESEIHIDRINGTKFTFYFTQTELA